MDGETLLPARVGTSLILPANIADRISAEHQAAHEAMARALDHAIRCGELLAEAKSLVSHGEWATCVARRMG